MVVQKDSMRNYKKPPIQEEARWVSTSFGCPQKNVKKVRVILTNGKIGYGMYINRERLWKSLDGKILNNVSAWRLVADSFQSLEDSNQQGDNNGNYKENCNYPDIEGLQ